MCQAQPISTSLFLPQPQLWGKCWSAQDTDTESQFFIYDVCICLHVCTPTNIIANPKAFEWEKAVQNEWYPKC